MPFVVLFERVQFLGYLARLSLAKMIKNICGTINTKLTSM